MPAVLAPDLPEPAQVDPSVPSPRCATFAGIEIAVAGATVRVGPEASEAQIATVIRGRPAEERRAARQARSRPLLEALEPWLREKLGLISQKSKLAEAIRYALGRWAGLSLFLRDGRVEIDSNVVERTIRPLALTRKNALFAGSDGGRSTGR